MTHESAPRLLALHSVRLNGFADVDAVADRFQLDTTETDSALRDFEEGGWIQHAAFADLSGWSLTDLGKSENERQLAAELDDVDARELLVRIYRQFLPANARLLEACTDWQVRPTATDALAGNDHHDPHWDAGVLGELSSLDRFLRPMIDQLSDALGRFRGYHARFTIALERARSGVHDWVDRTDIDSCHTVWFQLHEDLIATLGLNRHEEIRADRD